MEAAMLLSQLCLAVMLAVSGDIEPKTIRDFVRAGVGYAQPAKPVQTTLTKDEILQWRAILGATESQMMAIERMYQDHLRDTFNPHLDREVPRFLADAAEASAALRANGMTSSEFNTAWTRVSRSAIELMNSATELEVKFVDSIEPLLLPEQIKQLDVLRRCASRRRSRWIESIDRWITFELRDVLRATEMQKLDPAQQRAVEERLVAYEQSLTELLDQWGHSRLDAAKKIQLGFVAAARDGFEDPGFDPKAIWSRSAALTKRIRELQLSATDEIMTLAPTEIAHSVRAAAYARLFPELYPDELHLRIEKATTAPRIEFDQRYLDISRRLEAACVASGDEIASGVGQSTPQGLAAILAPLLTERRALCEEFLKVCCGPASE